MEHDQRKPPDFHPILRPTGKQEANEHSGQQAMGEHMVPAPIRVHTGQNRQAVESAATPAHATRRRSRRACSRCPTTQDNIRWVGICIGGISANQEAVKV